MERLAGEQSAVGPAVRAVPAAVDRPADARPADAASAAALPLGRSEFVAPISAAGNSAPRVGTAPPASHQPGNSPKSTGPHTPRARTSPDEQAGPLPESAPRQESGTRGQPLPPEPSEPDPGPLSARTAAASDLAPWTAAPELPGLPAAWPAAAGNASPAAAAINRGHDIRTGENEAAVVHVSIGRIEVRSATGLPGAPQPSARAESPEPAEPRISLERYLNGRG
jgi:hypothetical protein